MTCSPAAPPPTLPLPPAADPPRQQELRAQLVGSVGATDREGSVYSGGALRGTYAPLRGMLVGVELGGGARRNGEEQKRLSETERETVISGRLLVGYGRWLWPQRISVALEAGLTPGLHSEHGGFVAPDVTLSVSAGGPKWWVLTAGYRLAYSVPSRDEDWSAALYHVGALTLVVPRRARYAGFVQLGVHYGHLTPERGDSFGLAGVLGFRFSYGY